MALRYLFLYPSLSFLEMCPCIIPETYSTPIYYTNKNCKHTITFYVTLNLRPIKKQRNPIARENKTKQKHGNSHPNYVLRRMLPKLCVAKIYSLKGHLPTI